MADQRGDLLDISKLRVVFHTYLGVIKALNGVELWMNHGERLGIVGETGCGKSVTALSIMRLIEEPGQIVEGSIRFEDQLLTALPEKRLNTIRGRDMAMIFQEPIAALNPVMKVGDQIAESLLTNQQRNGRPSQGIHSRIRKMLELVGLDWQRTMDLYPHELSGGMAQRVMIAMALSTNPQLLIADEPTSALDVTIQAQILELLDELVRELATAIILITHDMGIAAQFCDKIAVMYAGNVVEYGPALAIFENPLHPYTQGLLKAVVKVGRTQELESIPGMVPDLVHPPAGCRFHPRCPQRKQQCDRRFPEMIPIEPGHYVACYLYHRD